MAWKFVKKILNGIKTVVTSFLNLFKRRKKTVAITEDAFKKRKSVLAFDKKTQSITKDAFVSKSFLTQCSSTHSQSGQSDTLSVQSNVTRTESDTLSIQSDITQDDPNKTPALCHQKNYDEISIPDDVTEITETPVRSSTKITIRLQTPSTSTATRISQEKVDKLIDEFDDQNFSENDDKNLINASYPKSPKKQKEEVTQTQRKTRHNMILLFFSIFKTRPQTPCSPKQDIDSIHNMSSPIGPA